MSSARGIKSAAKKKETSRKQAGRQKQQTIVLSAASPISVEVQAFTQLQHATSLASCLELASLKGEGNGLLASKKKSKSDVSDGLLACASMQPFFDCTQLWIMVPQLRQ